MYGTVKLSLITSMSITKSMAAGTSISIGSVGLIAWGGSLVKGSSCTDGEWRCSGNTMLGIGFRVEPILPDRQLLDS